MISSKNMKPAKESIIQATVRKLDAREANVTQANKGYNFKYRMQAWVLNDELVCNEKFWG